jgi:hypothetical protein
MRLPVTSVVSAATLGLIAEARGDAVRHARQVDALGVAWPDVVSGRLWRLVSNLLVQPDPGLSPVAHLVALGVAERRLGSRRALLLLLGGDWLSTLPVLVAVRAAGATRLSDQRDAGLSAGGAALVGGLAAVAPPARLRAPATAGFLLALAVAAARRRQLADVQHLAAGAVGVALARRWAATP